MSHVVLTTVEEIEAFPVYGNHYQDHPLWSELDRIIVNETLPFPLRLAASQKVDKILGEEWLPGTDPKTKVEGIEVPNFVI